MSVKNFIPSVWSAKVILGLEKKHVYGAVSNREYEGEINSFGDVVKVNQIGDITINSYAGTDITFQELDDAQRELKIDQKKYFAFAVDNVDKVQAKGDLIAKATQRAGYNLNDTLEQYIAALYEQAGLAYGTNAVPIDMNSANVEESFLAVAEKMDDEGVPRSGRFAIIPPWVNTKLVLAGLTLKTDNTELYKKGFMDYGLGFDFIMSQNVSKNSSSWDKTRIICGIQGESIALAKQLMQVKAVEQEKRFDDGVKGLLVYGAKIMRPDMTLTFYADKTAE